MMLAPAIGGSRKIPESFDQGLRGNHRRFPGAWRRRNDTSVTLTVSEASSPPGFAGWRRDAHGRCRRLASAVLGELLDQEIGEDLDALGPRSTGWRDPVDSSGWQRPIGHQSFQPAGDECVAQNEFWQDTDAIPAIRAGNIASPLFTRSGPDGRTVAVLPSLVKRQVSGVVV